MPFIESDFRIPDYIPFLGGEWGPFINTNLTKQQKWQVFTLFIVSLVLIFSFGAIAYQSSKKNHEKKQMQVDPVEEPIDTDPFSFSKFINVDKLIDFKSLMVGMGAGIVFGLIDNGGLWFGMDALDPVFEPDNVPWVYGYGGKRYYTGLDDYGESVYYGVHFKDGILKKGYKVGNYSPEDISKELQKEYKKVSSRMEHMKLKEKRRYGNVINVNEKAFADPQSELFLGSNMTRNQFFKYLAKHKINEDTYNDRVNRYKDYLNNKNLPTTKKDSDGEGIPTIREKKLKGRLKVELKKLKREKLYNIGRPHPELNEKISKIKTELKKLQPWPGRNKKLAQSWASGWRPGKLTQSGIGNTFSDFLGSFLATFVGVLIYNMTEISNVSLLSEVIGIVIGCIIGIIIPRTLLFSLSYKT